MTTTKKAYPTFRDQAITTLQDINDTLEGYRPKHSSYTDSTDELVKAAAIAELDLEALLEQ